MFLQKLNLINFRSYKELSITFPPEGALFEGLNGVGKTNLLEAIHLLCTGRSQRNAVRSDMISHGEECAFVEGVFVNAECGTCLSRRKPMRNAELKSKDIVVRGDVGADVPAARCPDIDNPDPETARCQDIDNPDPETARCPDIDNPDPETALVTAASLGFSRDKKIVMKRDGVDVASFSEWFGERPAISFGTDDLELVYGAPEVRRKFIDMLISQMDRNYLDALTSYRKAMACRNALFGKTNDAALFEVYEQTMAQAGATLVFRRAEVAAKLAEETSVYYEQISGRGEAAALEYICKTGAVPIAKENEKSYDFNAIREWQNVYLKSLAERRSKDAELMFTLIGPHRDDLRFLLDGRAAKSYASQGQCRSFALSLKLGATQLLSRGKNGGMIFLVDDAVSELDPERTSRVYPLLEGRGQIFIATPSCQATLGKDLLMCKVEPGKVTVS